MIGRDSRELGNWLVGLPGLEPGTSSLSEMDGRAPCYPAFPLVGLLRKSYKDGVNRDPAVQSIMVAGPQGARSLCPCRHTTAFWRAASWNHSALSFGLRSRVSKST
jgi:hypothetical protein